MDFRTISFVLVAGLIYGALHLHYTYGIKDDTLRTSVYPTLIGEPAVKIINKLTPDRKAKSNDNKISSRKAVLNIVRGCDGSGVWFMLIAALLGFSVTQTSHIAKGSAFYPDTAKTLPKPLNYLIAIPIAFLIRYKETIVGLILGSLVVYLVNQLRIVGLFYLVEWDRTLFPVVHTYFAPTLIILIIAGFFLWWTQWAMARWQKLENAELKS